MSIVPVTAKFDPADENLDKLIENNREWAENVKKVQPEFFDNIALKQEPKILWIGIKKGTACFSPSGLTYDFSLSRNIVRLLWLSCACRADCPTRSRRDFRP